MEKSQYIAKVIQSVYTENDLNKFLNENSDYYELDKLVCGEHKVIAVMKLKSGVGRPMPLNESRKLKTDDLGYLT